MSINDPHQNHHETVRETFESYEIGETTVSMIADPENAHAWIQSTATLGVEP